MSHCHLHYLVCILSEGRNIVLNIALVFVESVALVKALFSNTLLHYSVIEMCRTENTGCHQQQDLDRSLSPTDLVHNDLIDIEDKLGVSNMSN